MRPLIVLLLSVLLASAVPVSAGAPACSPIANCTAPGGCLGGFSQCFTCASGTYLQPGSGVQSDTCPACSPVAHCAGSVTCTTASDSSCSECAAGYYRAGDGSCQACSPVQGCTASLTCTTDSDSFCPQCETGRYLVIQPGGGSVCADCTQIDSCATLETCTSPTNSQCTECTATAYIVNGVTDSCHDCTDVDFCVSDETCHTASDSQCTQCQSGHYLNEGSADTCPACAPVANCQAEETCTSGSNSRCAACDSGYFRVVGNPATPDTCEACSPIAHCTSALTCSSATTTQCTSCEFGYYVDNAGGPSTVCAACPTVDHCSVPAGCTGATQPQCSVCESGYYLDETEPADRCIACAAVPGCAGTVTCSSATTSSCSQCASGYFRASNGTCVACSPVPNCVSSLTCTTAANSVCTSCQQPGFFLTAPGTSCQACTGIPFCTSDLTCTTAGNTRCTQCADGRYVDTSARPAGADVCATCADIAHCAAPETCTGPTDSTCPTCEPGYYVDGADCAPCTAVAHCNGTLTCASASTSQCSSCETGYTLDETAPADACVVTPTTTVDVPIAGNRARFGDLPKKRSNLVLSYDKAIDLMSLDPTVTGATLEIAGATPGSSFTLELPAADWKGPLPGRRFRVTKRGNPKIKVVLVSGRLLRVSLQGSNAYPLGAPQGAVSVTLTIGDTRFCTLFGGTISTDDGRRFVARRAPKPAACPAPPNQAPTAEPNDFVSNEDAVRAGFVVGNYSAGNVIADPGPNVDSDPEGDALTVSAIAHPTLTIAGIPVALTQIGVATPAFQFSYNGGTGTFVMNANGVVTFSASDPNLLGPLLPGESLVLAFDYTVADTAGNVSSPAHVTFTVAGNDPCFVFEGGVRVRRC